MTDLSERLIEKDQYIEQLEHDLALLRIALKLIWEEPSNLRTMRLQGLTVGDYLKAKDVEAHL